MDLIYRKEKYQNYLKKLAKLRGDDQDPLKEDHLEKIQHGVNDILDDLRDKSDITEIKLIYTLLSVPLIAILAYYSWKQGFQVAFFYLIGILLFFSIASYVMKNVIKANLSVKWQNNTDLSSEIYLSNKLSYVSTAIHIKEKRIELLQLFYCLFFAPLLFYLFVLIRGGTPFGKLWIGLAIAYLLSSPWWYFYFNNEKKEIKSTRQLLEEYYNDLADEND